MTNLPFIPGKGVRGGKEFAFSRNLYVLGFPGGSEVKASAWNMGDLGSIPGLGRSPGKGKWQPTPVLLPGESHGGRTLVGYSPSGGKELDFPFTFYVPSSVLCSIS